MRFCISSWSLLRRSRLTFRKRSNSVSTGCGAERAETLRVAGLDFFDCWDDEGTTSGTVVRVEEVVANDLVLLCAADYTTSAATILLSNEGYVLSLSPDHQQYLHEYAQQHDIIKTLTVKNNTYEVAFA